MEVVLNFFEEAEILDFLKLMYVILCKETSYVNNNEYEKIIQMTNQLQKKIEETNSICEISKLKSYVYILKNFIASINFKKQENKSTTVTSCRVLEIIQKFEGSNRCMEPWNHCMELINYDNISIIPDNPFKGKGKRIPDVLVYPNHAQISVNPLRVQSLLKCIRYLSPVYIRPDEVSKIREGVIELQVLDSVLTSDILNCAAECSDCIVIPVSLLYYDYSIESLMAESNAVSVTKNLEVLVANRSSFRYINLWDDTSVERKKIMKILDLIRR